MPAVKVAAVAVVAPVVSVVPGSGQPHPVSTAMVAPVELPAQAVSVAPAELVWPESPGPVPVAAVVPVRSAVTVVTVAPVVPAGSVVSQEG